MIRLIYVGLVGLFYSIPVFIYLVITKPFKKDPDFIHTHASRWARLILRLSKVKVDILGLENLKPNKNYIFVSNHQSSFDIMLLLGHLPIQFRFISKPIYFKIPIIGWAMKNIGYIPIDRSNGRKALASLQNAGQLLNEGKSIVLFPEGTRSKDGTIGPFKSGVLRLATFTEDISIIPVTLIGTYYIQPKGQLGIRPRDIKMVLSKPIPINKNIIENRPQREELLQALRETIVNNYNKYLNK